MRALLGFGRAIEELVAADTVLAPTSTYDDDALHGIYNQNIISLIPCTTNTARQVIQFDADGSPAV